MRFQRNASLLNTPSVLSKGFVSSANVIATKENVLLSVFLLFPVSAILTALLNFARGSIIETDLEQAVGRARLLRCDVTVKLFSNFPLRQAILVESEYDQKEYT